MFVALFGSNNFFNSRVILKFPSLGDKYVLMLLRAKPVAKYDVFFYSVNHML